MSKKTDPLDRLPAWLKAMVLGGREAWHLFKDFGDTLGDAIIKGLLAAQALRDLLGGPGGLALLGALAGGLSPLTGGVGIDWLSTSSLAIWSPVGVLPVAVVLLWLLGKSLGTLDREGERDTQRHQRERPQPGVEQQLVVDARRRAELNRKLQHRKDLPLLEDASIYHDVVADLLRRIRARFGNRDIAFVLERFTKKRGFKVVDVKGGLDREVKDRLELGVVEGHYLDQVLDERLASFQYRQRTVEFSIGPRRYLLLAVSGATIPEDVRADVSEATVFLMEEYVWAVDSIAGEA
jgi:hypothetical protein